MARVLKTLPFRARLLMLPVMQTLFRHTHLSVCRNVVLYQEAKKSNIEAGLSIAFQTPATAPRSTPLNISLEHCSNMLLDWSSQDKAATVLQLQARGINMYSLISYKCPSCHCHCIVGHPEIARPNGMSRTDRALLSTVRCSPCGIMVGHGGIM